MGRSFWFVVFLEMREMIESILHSTALMCSLCKSTLETSVESQSLTQGLNVAILVLLIPPVIIFVAVFFMAYKSSRKF